MAISLTTVYSIKAKILSKYFLNVFGMMGSANLRNKMEEDIIEMAKSSFLYKRLAFKEFKVMQTNVPC